VSGKAWLVSEYFPPPTDSLNGAYCIGFYYHMYVSLYLFKFFIKIYFLIERYGNNIGNLSIYTRYGKENPNLLWTKSGNVGNIWNLVLLNTLVRSDFVVIIEG
jgi:hypothetical protein